MPRLLVVDDEESICFSMSEYFSLHGYKVDTASEMEDEARRCGADAFLRKPKPLSQVAQVVQGLLESPPKQAARPA